MVMVLLSPAGLTEATGDRLSSFEFPSLPVPCLRLGPNPGPPPGRSPPRSSKCSGPAGSGRARAQGAGAAGRAEEPPRGLRAFSARRARPPRALKSPLGGEHLALEKERKLRPKERPGPGEGAREVKAGLAGPTASGSPRLPGGSAADRWVSSRQRGGGRRRRRHSGGSRRGASVAPTGSPAGPALGPQRSPWRARCSGWRVWGSRASLNSPEGWKPGLEWGSGALGVLEGARKPIPVTCRAAAAELCPPALSQKRVVGQPDLARRAQQMRPPGNTGAALDCTLQVCCPPPSVPQAAKADGGPRPGRLRCPKSGASPRDPRASQRRLRVPKAPALPPRQGPPSLEHSRGAPAGGAEAYRPGCSQSTAPWTPLQRLRRQGGSGVPGFQQKWCRRVFSSSTLPTRTPIQQTKRRVPHAGPPQPQRRPPPSAPAKVTWRPERVPGTAESLTLLAERQLPASCWGQRDQDP
uniref:basic salivary proline-rich protein 1-like n=1 Tax=Panthera onca TaxID=9690 RepID=UPI002954B80B|nr:basic salivary proline-rich protein 1-like [Panthera onca]